MERVVVFSDVSERDGIGIEVYVDEELVLEIFRDDAREAKTVSLYKDNFPLDRLEHYISVFNREIPTDFIKDRAENGIRTRGLQFGKLMLYQLSYFRLYLHQT